jgi:hypothetical protein
MIEIIVCSGGRRQPLTNKMAKRKKEPTQINEFLQEIKAKLIIIIIIKNTRSN